MLLTALTASWTLFYCLCAAEPLHLPLFRTGAGPLTSKDFSAIAARTRARYSGALREDKARRSSTELDILNGADIFYYTRVGIGTDPQEFNMTLDTSVSDFFVAGTACTSAAGCTDITLYDNTKSSTAVNKSTTTSSINFTDGSVNGFMFEDTITMGSFVVLHADFLYVTQSNNTLSSPISGMLGLGLTPPVATTTAIWQSAIVNGDPEFSFWLTRSNQSGAPGGGFTFGGTNTSFYTGDIEYLDVQLTSFTYWALNISEITVQGSPVIITGNTRLAAFEIGATYIIGPPADVAAIWSQVPGSSKINDSTGFYQYPCTTSVNITVSFGGRTWPILPEDMNIGTVSSDSTLCRGAIYGASLGSGLGWAFGDTWMRNVYSVFRQKPLAMGFAQLSAAAGGPATSSTPTPPSTLTPSSSPSPSPSDTIKPKSHAGAIAGGVVGGLLVIGLFAGPFFLYRHRRRQQNAARTEDPAPAARPAPEPLSFIINDDDDEAKSETTAPPVSVVPERSLSTMKRDQSAAVARYGDTHFVPDSMVQTADGLQLTAGRESMYWPSSSPPTSAAQLSRTASPGASPPSTPLPPGARAPNGSLPASSTEDPGIMQELRSLRAEVQRLAERSEAPPRYPNHGTGD